MRAWKYHMIDEQSSSSILRKMISEPQTGIEWLLLRSHIYVKLAPWLSILSFGHQKVVGSIPVWGSEIIFLRIDLDDHSSIIYFQALILPTYKCQIYFLFLIIFFFVMNNGEAWAHPQWN